MRGTFWLETLAMLLSIIYFCACRSVRQAELEIRIAELSHAGEEMRIPKPQAASHHFPTNDFYNLLPVNFMILVFNNSERTQFLADERYSIGYCDVEVELKLEDHIFHLKKREGEWTKNLMDFDAIPSGGVLAIPLVLSEYLWENCPLPIIDEDFECLPIPGEIRIILKRFFVDEGQIMKQVNSPEISSKWVPVVFQGGWSALLSPTRLEIE